MRISRILSAGLCLVALSGCWYHRPFLAHRYGAGCCPTPCCAPPAPHCSCYLGAPVPAHSDSTIVIAPQPGQ